LSIKSSLHIKQFTFVATTFYIISDSQTNWKVMYTKQYWL